MPIVSVVERVRENSIWKGHFSGKVGKVGLFRAYGLFGPTTFGNIFAASCDL